MKAPQVLFSVIVPTFNAAKTIERCIQSICEQDFPDYEIIVQDGISTDSTMELIKQLAFQYPQVSMQVISEKDTGIFDAMNRSALV
ncbi:MAG: glycosyltransferase, partial [Sphingobacteriales bacterium]